MRGDKYKSPNYVVSRAHISYLHHCAPHESGLSSCCTQPYYREIDCQKVSSSSPECAQTSWPVDYSSLVRRRCFCPQKNSHLVSHSNSQSATQPFGQSVKRPVYQSVIQAVNLTMSLPISYAGSQSNSQSTNQSCRQSVKQSVYQSVMQAGSQKVSLPISRADSRSNSQSTN